MADVSVIRKRADFLAANRGLRVARPGFVLLAHPNGGLGKRFGVTVTKKIGNAVVRNRMKRRFRELLRAALPDSGLPDHDHVLIGRQGGIAGGEARAHPHRPRLAARAIAGAAADLSLPAQLQRVRDPGARPAWRDQGWMDGGKAANALPPMGGTRLRPGALNRRQGNLT